MTRGVGGINEDVVEIYNDTNVEEVGEYGVHEALESGWRIGESHRHN
jgi:hypothetical protein